MSQKKEQRTHRISTGPRVESLNLAALASAMGQIECNSCVCTAPPHHGVQTQAFAEVSLEEVGLGGYARLGVGQRLFVLAQLEEARAAIGQRDVVRGS